MAEVKIAIAKTPKQAESLGKTITKTIDLSEAEARVFRDLYSGIGNKEEIAFGAVVSIMTLGNGGTAQAAKGIGVRLLMKALNVTTPVASGVFTSALFKSYYSQLASKFDLITNDNPKKCTMTYKYKRVGSNDGFYWLTNIKVN